MATLTLTVPEEYGYVLLTATLSYGVSLWLNGRVSEYRKIAKVPTPYQMALPSRKPTAADPGVTPDEHAFNCAQRAYGNFNEAYPSFLVGLLVGGIGFPRAATALGVSWSVSRVLYGLGYTSKSKPAGRGRYNGVTHFIGWLGVWGLVGYMGWKMSFP